MDKEKEEKIVTIQFDDEIVPHILDIFGKEIDEKGDIRDSQAKEIIIDRYSDEELNKNNFGGILPGSEIFIAKNQNSIAEYLSEIRKNVKHKLLHKRN